VRDGTKRSFKGVLKTDSLKGYVDGAQTGSEDTAVDVPDEIDLIKIGQLVNGTSQMNGLVSEVKITDGG
jgi:hypothetical protein